MPARKYYPKPEERPTTEESFNKATAKPDPYAAWGKGAEEEAPELTEEEQQEANKAAAASFTEKNTRQTDERGLPQVDATKISRSATKADVKQTDKPSRFITVMPKASEQVQSASEHEREQAGKTGMAFVDYPDTFEDLRRAALNPAAGRTLGDLQEDYLKYGDTFETSGADIAKARHLKGAVPDRASSPNRQITPTMGELPE